MHYADRILAASLKLQTPLLAYARILISLASLVRSSAPSQKNHIHNSEPSPENPKSSSKYNIKTVT